MTVAFIEKYPIAEAYFQRILKKRDYRDKVTISDYRDADAVLFDGKFFTQRYYSERAVVLLPAETKVNDVLPRRNFLFCGMHSGDAVTFSSIGEDRAMICLQKETDFCGMKIYPFETDVFFDRGHGIDKNLSVGFLITLLDLYFGEEKWKQKGMI